MGEFLILLGLFQFNPLLAVITGLSVIIGAVYMLKMYQRVMYGPTNTVTEKFEDLSNKEILLFSPIVLMIFIIGIYPNIILQLF